MNKVNITRRYRLPALHILRGPGMTASEAQAIFGGCSRLHGHDYRIEVTLTGPLDPITGILIQREEFDRLIKNALVDRYRGKNLSDFFVFTTGEALAMEFFKILEQEFEEPVTLTKIRVHETAKNSFIYRSNDRTG